MFHTKTKLLEICIDIDIEISEVDHFTWVLFFRIFRLALDVTILFNKPFKNILL